MGNHVSSLSDPPLPCFGGAFFYGTCSSLAECRRRALNKTLRNWFDATGAPHSKRRRLMTKRKPKRKVSKRELTVGTPPVPQVVQPQPKATLFQRLLKAIGW
jgi:hypothetical protein